MTLNYFVKCPVCGTITRLRSPAGYVYKTPVRIHCGKCKTLLTGHFISDNENIKAYYTPSNCEEVYDYDYDYYAEASGELLCTKLKTNNDKSGLLFQPNISPALSILCSIDLEQLDKFINYACYATTLSEHLDDWQIKYDLYLNHHNDLICTKYNKDAKRYGYSLDTEENITRFIYFSLFYDCGGIFKENEILKTLKLINYHFSHMNKTKLKEYIDILMQEERISLVQEKIFLTFKSFIKMIPYLLPALGASFYNDKSSIDKDELGLSTCSFDDIKPFYQDTFEVLSEFCDIIIGLDNIEKRNNYNTFKDKFTMKTFREQTKGNRIKCLDKNDFFANVFNLKSNSNALRNAIGHNDYEYDGIKQILRYKRNKKDNVIDETYLLDIAMECIDLMRSVYILTFIIYELLRYDNNKINLHHLFYQNTKSQNRCPCGSGEKYSKCCKNNIPKEFKTFSYPHKSNTCLPL